MDTNLTTHEYKTPQTESKMTLIVEKGQNPSFRTWAAPSR